MFSYATRPRQHDADIRRRNIDSFVEHLAGNKHRIIAVAKPLDDFPPLARLGLVRNGRYQKPPGNLIHSGVVKCKDQDPIATMSVEESFKKLKFRGSGNGDLFLLAIRLESRPT